jgi:hypothetical protein
VRFQRKRPDHAHLCGCLFRRRWTGVHADKQQGASRTFDAHDTGQARRRFVCMPSGGPYAGRDRPPPRPVRARPAVRLSRDRFRAHHRHDARPVQVGERVAYGCENGQRAHGSQCRPGNRAQEVLRRPVHRQAQSHSIGRRELCSCVVRAQSQPTHNCRSVSTAPDRAICALWWRGIFDAAP